MKIRIFLLAAATFAVNLGAEQLSNPDANTLWLENGINIQTGPRATTGIWYIGKNPLEIASGTDGKGFVLQTDDKKGRTPHTWIPLSREYPYLELAIAGIAPVNQQIFRGWVFVLRTPRKISFGGTTEPGVFVCNVADAAGADNKTKTVKAQFYIYNMRGAFDYIRLVKQPECLIETASEAFAAKGELAPGDMVKFKVALKEPAEDVALRLYSAAYNQEIFLNKQTVIQLKPEDEANKIWKAEVKIESLASRSYKKFNANDIFIKASVLGGAVKVPVWTTISYPYNPTK